MDASETKRPKALEGESSKLKRLLAQAMRNAAGLKVITEQSGDARAKRDAAMLARTKFRLSQPRACGLIGINRRVARPGHTILSCARGCRIWLLNGDALAIDAWHIFWQAKALCATLESCCVSNAKKAG